MDNHKAPKTGQLRLKDYLPVGQKDTQTRSLASTQAEQSSQVMLDTAAEHIKVAEEEHITTTTPEAMTEDRSLAFSSTLKMPGIAPRSPSARWTRKRFLLIGALLCLAVLLMAGIWIRLKALPPAVTLYQVGTQGFIQDIGGGGIVYPLQEENISYPIAERALAVLVAPGDHVTANQPLIRLDMAVLNAQIGQAKKDVTSASDYLNTVRASRDTVAIAQAQQLYNLAVDKYDALEAEASSSTLHNGTVISPINGIVTSLYIAPGEIFAANRTMIVIMDESAVIVRAEIPLAYLTQVHLGQMATVTPSSLPGINLQGKISTIIPQADSQTDTFEIWVMVANPQQMLLPGMNAFVHIHNEGKALGVPRLAVLNPERESIVFIVRNQHAYIQKVQVVARSVATLFVNNGISAGDRVVLVGANDLRNGQEVRVNGVESQGNSHVA
jgi:RND family efflux transporter MFP subunit